MTHRKAIILIVFCLSCIISSVGRSGDEGIPMRELLLMQDIPMVITPSKVEQSVLESPSTITVLTKEDIRRYGLNSFSDILRNVAGVDVTSLSPIDRNISMRGFNMLAAGRILSLVDSRPIYFSFYGLTLWELMPVSVDDIERIEIIKGPGSALYGANAFNGIVNIITKPVSSDRNTELIGEVDQSGKAGGSITHGGRSGRLTYRASLGWDRVGAWDEEKEDGGDNKRFNSKFQYSIDDISRLTLSAGAQNRAGNLIIFSNVEPEKYKGTGEYLKMQYERSNLRCQAFWEGITSVPMSNEDPILRLDSSTLDLEIQHSFHFSDSNFITWGLSYQLDQIDWKVLDDKKDQNMLAGFIQDQFRLSNKLNLTAGIRYDKHPMTGNSISPRGSIVYNPSIGHAFRASAGRSFRNPPIFYSYLSVDYDFSAPILPVPVSVRLQGNEDLSPEWITAFELGYQGNFGTRLKGGVDLFFSKYDGLVNYELVEYYAENVLFPGCPGEIIPSVVTPSNILNANVRGGEINASFRVTRWLSAHANYSYQYIKDSETGEKIKNAPLHKFNSGLSANLGADSVISLFANYVDRTVWGEVRVNSITYVEGVEMDSYTLLNFAASHRLFGGDSEIAMSVFNLLDDKHLEHPRGSEVGRTIMLKLICRI